MAYSDYGAFVYLNGERRTDSRDGETWKCDYDCMFGAGFDDIH